MTFRYCCAEANAFFFPMEMVLPELACGADTLGLLSAADIDADDVSLLSAEEAPCTVLSAVLRTEALAHPQTETIRIMQDRQIAINLFNIYSIPF